MKESYTLKVSIFDTFIDQHMAELQKVMALSGRENTEENLISLLEFLLGLGCYGHIERNLEAYLKSCQEVKHDSLDSADDE